ncbi:MAG: glycosyltransferase [bacterium]
MNVPLPKGASDRLRLVVYRPALEVGGAEKLTVTLLRHISRTRFEPILVLRRRTGVWLRDVPADVPILSLQSAPVRTAWIRLARLLRELRPQVVLSMSSGGNLTAVLARVFSGLDRCGLILVEANTFSHVRRLLPRWLPVTFLKSVLYRRADRVIAYSHGVAEDLMASVRLPGGLVDVVATPVVDETLEELAAQPLDHPWFGDKYPVLLSVGRLADQKDFPTLLRAFARLRQGLVLRMVILGEGERRGDLEMLAASLGVADDVQFPGFVANPYQFMRRCSVFVLSSQYEGMPTVLVEAMACGAPVVSTDCPSGPREVVHDGVNGYLVPVGDEASLAVAVERLLQNERLRDDFIAKGKSTVARFSAREVVKRYEGIVDRVAHCS